MSGSPPFAELPEEVTFSLGEVADLLYVVDVAVEVLDTGGDDHGLAKRVQRLITHRLWPELGGLLGDGEEG